MKPSPSLQKVIDFHLNLQGTVGDRIPELFAEKFLFHDPFLKTSDMKVLVEHYNHIESKVKNAKFSFQQYFEKENSAVIYWIFTGEKLGTQIEIHGSWYLEFDLQGMVSRHVDYWDLYTQGAEKIPILGWLFRLAKKILF